MSDSMTASGKYAYEYSHGKWLIVSNPVFEEDASEDDLYPGNFGYSPIFISQAVGIITDDDADKPGCKHPYIMQIRIANPMEIICVTDFKSLIELWDKMSVIFGLKHEEC